ncbi:MAG: zf-TFIIB domain-containing protein [Leptolyngbyaceae bacterium]|nr:zf-TFIIB domain-containing protein [Leptolyngbyaceae bacterium]
MSEFGNAYSSSQVSGQAHATVPPSAAEKSLRCPKHKHATLMERVLNGGLPAMTCPECEGDWLPGETYRAWQQRQPEAQQNVLPTQLNVPFEPAATDTQASLCPECQHYLSRAKLGQKHSFYLERCSNCEGIWCDRGEWDVLQRMGLQASLSYVFSGEWKTRLKALEYAERERQATIDKLGEDIAYRLFELADLLERHPNGDFGVAYLMRRFDQSS